MAFALVGPDFDGWLHVDYFDASGLVHHITPSPYSPLRRLEAREAVAVGAGGDAGLALSMTVGPPFGKDLLVAIVATAPLAEADRPVAEPGAAYLDRLAERVAQAAADGAFRGEWAYIFVETFPRGGRARQSEREQ
jgi:hypothetical protein